MFIVIVDTTELQCLYATEAYQLLRDNYVYDEMIEIILHKNYSGARHAKLTLGYRWTDYEEQEFLNVDATLVLVEEFTAILKRLIFSHIQDGYYYEFINVCNGGITLSVDRNRHSGFTHNTNDHLTNTHA